MIKTILFDTGGVVFLQDTAEAFRRFTEIGVDARQFIGDYGQKGIILNLENGAIFAEDFRAEISKLVKKGPDLGGSAALLARFSEKRTGHPFGQSHKTA